MLDRIVEKYLDRFRKSGYSVNSSDDMTKVITRFSTYLKESGINDFNAVNLDVIERYLVTLKEKGFKKQTIGYYNCRIKRFFQYMAEKKIVISNPFVKEKESYPAEFETYMNGYLKLKEHENTCFSSMTSIRQYLNLFYDFLSKRSLTKHSEVRKEDLTDFMKYLIDLTDAKGETVYKAVTVNVIVAALKPFIQWLSMKGVFPAGFSGNLTYLRIGESITRNVLTRKELVALFSLKVNNLYEFMLKTILVLLYASGLRIGELIAIELKDIDFKECVIRIYEPKTGKERAVQIGEVGAKYLKMFIDRVRPKVSYDFKTSNKVFLSCHEGKVLVIDTVNRYLKKFCKQLGITKSVTCHCFRHSYGTHLLENGLGIKQVSDLLGHRDLTTTEHYTRLSPERLRKTIRLFHPLEADLNHEEDEKHADG